ncbi:MAG TPA: hypothetical protein VIK03_00310 [Thermoleophilia bacterium]
MIPNGVQLEMHIAETAGGDPTTPIECSAVAIRGGLGAEVASDFDEHARIGIREQPRGLFAYAGKRVLALEELRRMSTPDSPGEAN